MKLIAGPCAAESRDQVLLTARQLAEAGVETFRAGAWKPRTKPGGFEGRGAEALEWLAEAKAATGMRAATEVGCAAHVRQALDSGVDMVWLGARTTANPFAVQEIADALNGSQVEVLVKNPVSPDLELWIGALERLRTAGVERLTAVHRGFTTYHPEGEEAPYRNDPIWRIPLELRRRMPSLPILGDPSHMGGRRELVGPLARQALALGWDGLMIEAHCDPASALSDAAQQLTPSELSQLLATLRLPVAAEPTPQLEAYRRQLDRIDAELIDALARRMDVSRRIGRYKAGCSMPVLQPARYDALMRTRLTQARERGLDPAFVRQLLAALHAESVRVQLDGGAPG